VANTNLPASLEKLHWRTSQRGNPFALVDGFNVVIFRRQTGEWSVRIEELETGQDCYPEGRYSDEREARTAAFQALQRIAAGAPRRPDREVVRVLSAGASNTPGTCIITPARSSLGACEIAHT
jgi:hypothetical protein